MKKASILYVEDEISLASIVKDTLQGQGFLVHWYPHGQDILTQIETHHIDLVILDVMLPKQNGFELAEKISLVHPDLPFLFTSAKNQSSDVIQGLKLGAKDYLKKPFNLEELLLRINNIISLNQPLQAIQNKSIAIGQYIFNAFDQTLIFADTVRNLTHLETEIISHLVKKINSDLIKKNMLLQIWGDDTQSNSRNLDVYINKIRDYLSQDSSIRIVTLRGKGYRFIVGPSE